MRYFRNKRDAGLIHDGATFGGAGQPPDWAAELWEEVAVFPADQAVFGLPEVVRQNDGSWVVQPDDGREDSVLFVDNPDVTERRALIQLAAARAERGYRTRQQEERERAAAAVERELRIEATARDVVEAMRQVAPVDDWKGWSKVAEALDDLGYRKQEGS